MVYYQILDKGLIGRQNAPFACELYNPDTKIWERDKNHILMDRIIGYDGDGIGASDMLLRIEEITESEAQKLIGGDCL